MNLSSHPPFYLWSGKRYGSGDFTDVPDPNIVGRTVYSCEEIVSTVGIFLPLSIPSGFLTSVAIDSVL
jgi:hypothetical protein